MKNISVRHENILFQESPDLATTTRIIAKINKKYYHIYKNQHFDFISISLWSEKTERHIKDLGKKNSFRDAISFVKQLIKKENQKICETLKYQYNKKNFVIRIFVNGN